MDDKKSVKTETEKKAVNCKECRCFVNFCRKYKKYTPNCSEFIKN